MKTKLRYREMGIFIVLFLGMMVSSCTKEVAIDPESEQSSELSLKSVNIPAKDDVVCNLIAGQSIDVGKVVYSHIGDQLLVEYVTTGEWILSEVHFYIGNMDDFKLTCMNKKGMQIGHFPYSISNLNSSTSSFSILLSDIVDPDPDGYLVIAHAVVRNGKQEETAFAKCTYQPIIITIKSKFTTKDTDIDPFFLTACSDGDYFYTNSTDDYCHYLGINYFVKGEDDVYQLQSPKFPIDPVTGLGVGKVMVTNDDNYIYITVISTIEMYRSHLFVGTVEGLELIRKRTANCVDYTSFPYRVDVTGYTHTFNPIPIPANLTNFKSFEEAFDITRWGWLSYYKI